MNRIRRNEWKSDVAAHCEYTRGLRVLSQGVTTPGSSRNPFGAVSRAVGSGRRLLARRLPIGWGEERFGAFFHRLLPRVS